MGELQEMRDAVICYGGFGAIDIWSAGMAKDLARVLTRRGFRAMDKDKPSGGAAYCPSIVARPLRARDGWLMGGRDLRDISNWDLRPVYSESF